jgi:hypothetical protein
LDIATIRKESAMPIIFEGEPPYEELKVESALSEPTQNGVVLTANVGVDGLDQLSVPIRLVLAAEVARALAGQLAVNAKIVGRWQS